LADDYARAYQLLRDGNFLMSRISAEDRSSATDKTVTLSDAEVLADHRQYRAQISGQ